MSLGTKGFTLEQAIEPVVLRPEMVSLPLDAFRGDDADGQEAYTKWRDRCAATACAPQLSVYGPAMLDGALG